MCIRDRTLFWFLLCSFLALLLAGCVGYGTYSMGLFNTRIEGLAAVSYTHLDVYKRQI